MVALGKGNPPPPTRRINAALHPLAHLNDDGTITHHSTIASLNSLYAVHANSPESLDPTTFVPEPLHPINFVAATSTTQPTLPAI